MRIKVRAKVTRGKNCASGVILFRYIKCVFLFIIKEKKKNTVCVHGHEICKLRAREECGNGGTKYGEYILIAQKYVGRSRCAFNRYINNTHDKIYELGGNKSLKPGVQIMNS